MNASIPTREDIQQLKSILDDLTAKFREHDELVIRFPSAHRDRRRAKRIQQKLVKQIPALSNLIKYLNEA